MLFDPPLKAPFVALLSATMIVAQLSYPPHTRTKWRARLRWGFLLGTFCVGILVLDRILGAL